MSTSSTKRKESPAEPLKRALGMTVRAIAAKHDLEVSYAAGPPELSGNSVTLPEPSRIPGRREIAVIRGHADSLALTASCHDVKLHNKLVPWLPRLLLLWLLYVGRSLILLWFVARHPTLATNGK